MKAGCCAGSPMQEASARCIAGRIYPPFVQRCRDGYQFLPNVARISALKMGLILTGRKYIRNQSGTRMFVLAALLLFAFPLLLTFAKFVALVAVSSHQFVRQ